MIRRKFLKLLGFGVPTAAALAALPSVVSTKTYPESLIKNWKSHPYHYTATLPKDYEFGRSLRPSQDELKSLFVQMAERRQVLINTGTTRQFFQYGLGSKS